LLSLFALLPLAVQSFAQDSPVGTSSIAEGNAIFETPDAMAAQYTEALTMMYAWGAVREDFLKHPEEPASRYDEVYTTAQFFHHFFPKSYVYLLEKKPYSRGGYGAPPDIPPDHWSAESGELLAACGFFAGYPDGVFKGESSILRYEAAMVASKVHFIISQSLTASGSVPLDYGFDAYTRYLESMKMGATSSYALFIDIPEDHWAYEAVWSLSESGVLIDEFGDSGFRGYENISRATLALWLYKLAGAFDLEDFVETEPVLTPTYNGGSGCGG